VSALKVYACVQWDEPSGTCLAHAYIDPPSVIPTLTAEQGAAIGVKLLGCYVVVKAVGMLREAITDRIGS